MNQIPLNFDATVLSSLDPVTAANIGRMIEVIVNSLNTSEIDRLNGTWSWNPEAVADGAELGITKVFVEGSLDSFVWAVIHNDEDALTVAEILLAEELSEGKYEGLLLESIANLIKSDVEVKITDLVWQIRSTENKQSEEFQALNRFFKALIATMVKCGLNSGSLTSGVGEH